MTAFFTLIVMAAVITATIDYVTMIFVDHKIHWEVGLAIVLGIATAWAFQLSLFDILGIEAAVPFIEYLLTGILISRGSNWLFDFLDMLMRFKTGNKEYPAE